MDYKMRLRKRDTLNSDKNNDDLKRNASQATKINKNNSSSKRIKSNAPSSIQSTKITTNKPKSNQKTAEKDCQTPDDCGKTLQQSSLNENEEAVGGKVANRKSLIRTLHSKTNNITTNLNTQFSDLLKQEFSNNKNNVRVTTRRMSKKKSLMNTLQPIVILEKIVLTNKERSTNTNSELSCSVKQRSLNKKTFRSKLTKKKSLNSILQPVLVLTKAISNGDEVDINLNTKGSILQPKILSKNIEETMEDEETPTKCPNSALQPDALLLKTTLIDRSLKSAENCDVPSKSSSTGKCKFQQLDENEERIKNDSGLADRNAKPSQSRHILRKKKTVNYLEETLNTSNTLTRPLNDKPKLPIYKQQLEKRPEPKNDLYEFDSDSEKVSKRKKKQVDDSSFVVKIKTKRGPKKKINKQPIFENNLILKNKALSPKSTAIDLTPKNNVQLERKNEKIQKIVNKKQVLKYTSIRLKPAVASTPHINTVSPNYNVRLDSDKKFDKLYEKTSDKSTNLSIIERRPEANSTLIHLDTKANRKSIDHMTVQNELDDWGDAEPSMSPDRGMNNSRFFFTENIPRANSTMITRTKLNNPKRSNYTVTDKENLSPNVTPPFKIKKNRKVTDYFKSDKIEKLSNIDEHISQSQNKIVDRRSSEDEAEVVQDNEDLPDNECLQGNESDDDDDDWFDFEKSSKKTDKTPKPINAFRPWRFNQINVNRSPLFITIKDTALPSINQELVVNHTIAKKIKTTKANTCEEGNHDWVDDGEVKLFEDTVALVSDEEDEAPEEFDAKLMKKSKFKLKYFLNMDVAPKKPKDVRTKEEQKAADDWANAFNLMCKEVEEFPLEIE